MNMKWNKVVKEEASMLKRQVKLWKLKDEKIQDGWVKNWKERDCVQWKTGMSGERY